MDSAERAIMNVQDLSTIIYKCRNNNRPLHPVLDVHVAALGWHGWGRRAPEHDPCRSICLAIISLLLLLLYASFLEGYINLLLAAAALDSDTFATSSARGCES